MAKRKSAKALSGEIPRKSFILGVNLDPRHRARMKEVKPDRKELKLKGKVPPAVGMVSMAPVSRCTLGA